MKQLGNVTTRAGKWSLICSFMLIVTILVTACGGNTPKDNTAADPNQSSDTGTEAQVIKDAMGHDVKIPANPQRIIATYLEDPLLVVGNKPVAQWSVANGIQDYLQDQLDGIPTIPYDLPPETVASFNPDFIIIGSESSVQNGLYEQYSKIAPTYVVGDAVTADWRNTLTTLASILGKSQQADAALNKYDQKVEQTKGIVDPVLGNKKVAAIWLVSKNFYVVNGTVASGAVLYGDLGLKLPNVLEVLPEATANWNPISLEKLVQLDADYIFLVNSDKGQSGNLEDPLWKNIPAVKNGHVYEVDSTSSWLYNGLIAGERVMDDLVQFLGSK